ncbi:hypothetical protein FPV67DRAFT_1695479, partial [Lyophyllum atratum]
GCAFDEHGNLKNASDIDFYESETDTRPISGPGARGSLSSRGPNAGDASGNALGQRSGRGANMADLVAAEGLGSDGEPEKAKKSRTRRAKRSRGTGKAISRKRKSNVGGEDSDAQDGDFAVDSDDSESSDDSDFTDDEVVGNAELAAVLPSKSIPTTGRGSGLHTRKRKATHVIEVEDEDSPRRIFARSSSPVGDSAILEEISTSASRTKQTKDKRSATRNPIYYFYERVERGADGRVGEAGDKHYKCHHGNSKIFTLKKTGKSNLTSMVNNLKACSPPMYHFYSILKDRPADQPVTENEIAIAAGAKVLDPIKAKEYFRNLEVASENIRAAFEKQSTNAAVRNFVGPLGSRKV